jgi:hypothetical protein
MRILHPTRLHAPHRHASRLRTVAAACALLFIGAAQAADAPAAGAGEPAAANAKAETAYRCDLRASEQLCRQYHVVADIENRVNTLRENCTALGGKFSVGASCPTQARVARCMDVVPDPNVLDLLSHTYDAHYYDAHNGGGSQSRWNRASVREVCVNLLGEYIAD